MLPYLWQNGFMARVKTTLSIDETLIRRVRVRAARTGKPDSSVMEEALREGLGVIERLRAKALLDEEGAIALAHDVLGESIVKAPRSKRA
jgi:plasmid stability protein